MTKLNKCCIVFGYIFLIWGLWVSIIYHKDDIKETSNNYIQTIEKYQKNENQINNELNTIKEDLQIKIDTINKLEEENKILTNKNTELEKTNKNLKNENNNLKKKINNKTQTSVIISAATGNKATYQAYAKNLVLNSYGWSIGDYNALVTLWERESNWNPTAKNKSSGAYGIPQALPASKMSAYGSDYLTNYQTQIKWGLNYIKTRYGSPTAALAHSNKKGWY